MSLATYVSQLGPDGLGHDRCGQACLTSVLLDKGWDSDPYLLLQELTHTPPSQPDQGTTADDLISLAQQKGFAAATFTFWHEAFYALQQGHSVVALCDNSDLRPTAYPNTPGWHALHWIRLVAFAPDPTDPDSDFVLCEDPLTYLPQPSGPPYQGPTLYTTSSIRAAIEATPESYAGIIVSRGDDAPTPAPQEPASQQEPAQ